MNSVENDAGKLLFPIVPFSIAPNPIAFGFWTPAWKTVSANPDWLISNKTANLQICPQMVALSTTMLHACRLTWG